ncbi:hypothetical protein P0082_08885 [Candidatus Haliotispira prima]|uniref:DUF3568 family protein n=1 Tax=Candidatus Haliotispira prima TaxID=3034016 RepID=A0ABY8MF28_9SPIO|nr:hypothetical protein P0082_08885 [Candidatus Haliotispira prima]
MRNKFVFGLLSVLVLMLSGCITSQYSNLQYGFDTEGYSEVSDLDVRVSSVEFFGDSGGINLFNISATNTDKVTKAAIKKEIEAAGGTAARNIKLVQKASFWNLLVNMITLKIVAPSKVMITGNIIKKNSGASGSGAVNVTVNNNNTNNNSNSSGGTANDSDSDS